MDDDVERVAVKRSAQRGAVRDLRLPEQEAGRRLAEVAKPGFLQGNVVVVVEVVDADDLIAARRKRPDGVIADKAGRACNQDPQLIPRKPA